MQVSHLVHSLAEPIAILVIRIYRSPEDSLVVIGLTRSDLRSQKPATLNCAVSEKISDLETRGRVMTGRLQ